MTAHLQLAVHAVQLRQLLWGALERRESLAQLPDLRPQALNYCRGAAREERVRALVGLQALLLCGAKPWRSEGAQRRSIGLLSGELLTSSLIMTWRTQGFFGTNFEFLAIAQQRKE